MNQSAHPVSQEEVMALLDGELSTQRREIVSMHLDACRACSALAARFRELSSTLRAWGVEPMPEKLADRVADSATKKRSGVQARSSSIFVRASFWRWKQWLLGLGAAAAVLILFVAVSVPNLHRREPGERLEIRAQQAEVSNRMWTELDKRADGQTAQNGPVDLLGSMDEQLVTVSGPMIARRVSLSMVVKDFSAARQTLDSILARHRSYAAELGVNTAEGSARTLTASLRVPVAELPAALDELKQLGRVLNETQSGEEVTEQHVDLVARLKNSRGTEQRLQAILLERTGKISDVLQVEQEIARVRGEIEQMEAQEKTLEHRVDFAAVNLNLSDVYRAQMTTPFSVGTRLRNGFVNGYHKAAETMLGMVLFLFEDGPELLIWLGLVGMPALLFWRRYRRSLATV
jgi:Domain of unknown function (DUF4349)/Putative zinc-finger